MLASQVSSIWLIDLMIPSDNDSILCLDFLHVNSRNCVDLFVNIRISFTYFETLFLFVVFALQLIQPGRSSRTRQNDEARRGRERWFHDKECIQTWNRTLIRIKHVKYRVIII